MSTTCKPILDLNNLYLIACYQCRIFGGLVLYKKMDNELFHIISQFALTPKFKFPESHPVFKIEDNGLTVHCPTKPSHTFDWHHGTIQFGEFLNPSHKLIYRATFKLKQKCVVVI